MFKLGTKSETLGKLREIVTKCEVLPLYAFSVEDWEKDWAGVLCELKKVFCDAVLIVRSSAVNEDTERESHAGEYESVLNVRGEEELEKAVTAVIASFCDDNKMNQVLVQPMLEQVEMSGVVFTRNPSNASHYYVVNYDDSTGFTDTITSGTMQSGKMYYCMKSQKPFDNKLARVVEMAEELEQITGLESLDIEFAFAQGGLYLLQVRPLIIKGEMLTREHQEGLLRQIAGMVKNSNGKKPYLYGDRTIYGVMPDWNPAEMIGLHPKPLAMSLYKYLITDGTWAYQRDNYGYRNLRSFPLMVDFCGLPYIDVRVSFNSFLPKELDEELSEKLVNYYLDALASQPEKHDKVEFEIILSCYTFTLDKRLEELCGNGFTEAECLQLKEALRKLTNHIINVQDGLWITDSEKVQKLIERHTQIQESDLDNVSKIYWLLEDCNRYGTLPFAGMARAGFIAVQLLKSLVEIGVLSEAEYDAYMAEMNTVSSQMSRDGVELSAGAFLKKYGHLRPGTYDITSCRYDRADYLAKEQIHGTIREQTPFRLSLKQYRQIDELMKQNGLEGDVLALFKFIQAAIEGREYAKFIFTKSLSDAIELIAQMGEELGYSREDMSYADIRDITELYACADNKKERIEQSIARGRRKYDAASALSLPPVILGESDVYEFHLPDCVPNYITLGQATGELCSDLQGDLRGKIVLLSAADPGYDWLFTRGIGGLITAFGGANSHMAIRAGELSIPAVIGVGEKKFLELQTAGSVCIDCGTKRIEVIN